MKQTIIRRFLSKVTPNFEDLSGCWEWTDGAKTREGYGRFQLMGKSRAAHRIIYQLLIGPIGQNKTIDHLCRNPSCVNPSHLECVTIKENLSRKVMRTRSYCRSGHALIGDNVRIYRGQKVCVSCLFKTAKKPENHEKAKIRWRRLYYEKKIRSKGMGK